MIKIEYIYKKNDTKNTKSGSCVLCIILYFIVFLKYVYFVFSDPGSDRPPLASLKKARFAPPVPRKRCWAVDRVRAAPWWRCSWRWRRARTARCC